MVSVCVCVWGGGGGKGGALDQSCKCEEIVLFGLYWNWLCKQEPHWFPRSLKRERHIGLCVEQRRCVGKFGTTDQGGGLRWERLSSDLALRAMHYRPIWALEHIRSQKTSTLSVKIESRSTRERPRFQKSSTFCENVQCSPETWMIPSNNASRNRHNNDWLRSDRSIHSSRRP